MKLEFKNHQLLLLIPALFAFLITLIPTLSYQWPLSWDIIYHIGYAKAYSQYVFALINHLSIPTGQKIDYPPLFHFLIAFLGNALNIDYFQIARFLQPFLAMSIVLSVSYVAKKLYGNIAGISAGFLIISSYTAFRIMMPLPENLVLIFVTFSVYFYYTSLSKKIPKYALIAGILLLLTIATHRHAPLILILVISSFTLLELIIYRNKSVLKNYGAFFLPLIIPTACGAFLLMLWKPDLLHNILQQGISVMSDTSVYNTRPLSPFRYIGSFGVFISIFAFIGGIIAIKKRHKKDIFILTWIIVPFLISISYLFGINNIESDRFLTYMLIPLSILGGYGLKQVYHKLKEYPRFSSLNFRSAFLISIFVLSIFFGLLNTEKPFTFYSETSLGKVQIAPPSPSEVDLANWFKANGDKEKGVIISNRYPGIFLSAAANMQINPNFKRFDKNSPKSAFDKKNIGYIVYDKRLTIQSKNGTFYRESIWSQLFYYSGDIHENIDKIIPSSARIVYENKDFIVCKIE